MSIPLSVVMAAIPLLGASIALEIILAKRHHPLPGLVLPLLMGVLMGVSAVVCLVVLPPVWGQPSPASLLLFLLPPGLGLGLYLTIYAVCRAGLHRRRSALEDSEPQPFFSSEPPQPCKLPLEQTQPLTPQQYYRRRVRRFSAALAIALLGPLVLLFPAAMHLASINLAFGLCFVPTLLIYLVLMRRELKQVWSLRMAATILTALLSNFLFILESDLIGLMLLPVTILCVLYTGIEIMKHLRRERELGIVPQEPFDPQTHLCTVPSRPDHSRAIALGALLLVLGLWLVPPLLPHSTVYTMDGVTVTAPAGLRRISHDQLYSRRQKATYTVCAQSSREELQALLEHEVQALSQDPMVTHVYRLANALANEGYSVPKYPDVNVMRLHTPKGQTYHYDIVVSERSDNTLRMTAILRIGGRALRITADAPLTDDAVQELHATLKELLRHAR